jgi:hypothetical protein
MNAVLFAGLRMMFPLLLHPGKNLYYGDYYYNNFNFTSKTLVMPDDAELNCRLLTF